MGYGKPVKKGGNRIMSAGGGPGGIKEVVSGKGSYASVDRRPVKNVGSGKSGRRPIRNIMGEKGGY